MSIGPKNLEHQTLLCPLRLSEKQTPWNMGLSCKHILCVSSCLRVFVVQTSCVLCAAAGNFLPDLKIQRLAVIIREAHSFLDGNQCISPGIAFISHGKI